MIINETHREKGRRIPFGHSVRGLKVYNLELVYDDLTNMLDMDSGELKEHIYSLTRCMDYAKRDSSDSRYAQISREKEMYQTEHMRMRGGLPESEEKFREMFEGKFGADQYAQVKIGPKYIPPMVKSKPTPNNKSESANGICWSEE